MKKENIVKKSNEFSRIIKKKQGKANNYFIINKEKNNDNKTLFGITFTKNIGNAVTRNKLKRRVKSIIDNNKEMYNNSTTYIIIIRKPAIDLSYQEMGKEIKDLFSKIKGD